MSSSESFPYANVLTERMNAQSPDAEREESVRKSESLIRAEFSAARKAFAPEKLELNRPAPQPTRQERLGVPRMIVVA